MKIDDFSDFPKFPGNSLSGSDTRPPLVIRSSISSEVEQAARATSGGRVRDAYCSNTFSCLPSVIPATGRGGVTGGLMRVTPQDPEQKSFFSGTHCTPERSSLSRRLLHENACNFANVSTFFTSPDANISRNSLHIHLRRENKVVRTLQRNRFANTMWDTIVTSFILGST